MIAILLYIPLATSFSFADEQESIPILEQTNTAEIITSTTSIDESTQETTTSPIESVTSDKLPEQLEGSIESQLNTPIDYSPFSSTGTSTASTTIIFENSKTTSTTTEEEQIAASTTPELNSTEDTTNLPLGTTTVSTGLAVSMANILNITNTNITNSTGSITLLNIVGNQTADIDLRTQNTSSTIPCTLLSCNTIDTFNAKIISESTVDSTISLTASSGDNEITTASSAIITTGDVYAGLNLINVANTTLVDSHYLLLSLNSFGDINGDIIFPSLSTFFSQQSSSTPSSGFETITTQSTASLVNNLNVETNTGNNALGSSTGLIQTGNGNTSLNVYNNTNSILIGGNSLLLLIKVTGTWLGSLVGVPTSLRLQNDGTTNLLQMNEDTSLQSASLGTLESTSTAFLTNTVSLLATSGNNNISDTNTSQITTGDAYASANIINIANTHIIGRNWILAIITIFGDLRGDIAFGRPDLWIGEQVSGESTITNDGELLYTITIINNGDSSSSDVNVTSIYDSVHLDITDSNNPYTVSSDNHLIFSVHDIAPQESKEIRFHAKIKDTLPGTAITNTVTAYGKEKDNNKADNTDTTTITTTSVPTVSSSGGYQYITPSIIIITTTSPLTTLVDTKQNQLDTLHTVTVVRTSTSTTLEEGASVIQTIVIKNPTTTVIPSVQFNDFLFTNSGVKIKTESWDIGDLLPNEEVTLSYSLSFSSQAQGIYTLSSEALGNHSQSIYFRNNGVVTYIPKIKNNQTSATSTTRSEVHSFIALITKQEPTHKLFNPIRGNPFIETAYAANEGTGGEANSSFQYVILFALFSILRLFRKQPRSYNDT